MSEIIKWFLVVAALAVGLGGGYYYGFDQGVVKEKAAEVARANEAAKKAAEAANPFASSSTNPFESATVNPYDNIKTNPFQ